MISKYLLIKLYINNKISVPKISKQINKSEGEINYWISKYGINKRSISDALYLNHNKGKNPFEIPKFLNNKKIYNDALFLYGIGLGLYWGEGTKRDTHSVRLGNSDPKLIKKFIDFLYIIFRIDRSKLKFGLQIFSDIEPEEAISYWQKILDFPVGQFYKPIITKSGKIGTYRYKSKYGVMTLYFNNTKLRNFIFEKITQL